jgi:hypothetical protein
MENIFNINELDSIGRKFHPYFYIRFVYNDLEKAQAGIEFTIGDQVIHYVDIKYRGLSPEETLNKLQDTLETYLNRVAK